MLIRLLRLLALPAIVLSGSLVTAPMVVADDDDRQIAINETVRGSLFYIQTTYTAHVLVPGSQMQNGQDFRSNETTATFTCSGFAVDASGYIATAGHCVDPQGSEVLNILRERMVVDAIDQGNLDAAAAADFLSAANSEEWPVEGSRRGSSPDRLVEVIQPSGPNRVVDNFVTAQVVDYQEFSNGDNALLKIPTDQPLRPLVVANKAPEPGQSLTSVGWPGSVARVIDQSRLQQPSFKSGTASSQQVRPSGQVSTEINADVSGGMSGGPTVDNDTGEVLGINSYGINGETQAFNFITDTAELRTFLLRNGVTLAQSEVPEESSFPWWIVIGLVVIAVGAVLVALVVRRRKTTPASAVGSYPPAPPTNSPPPAQ